MIERCKKHFDEYLTGVKSADVEAQTSGQNDYVSKIGSTNEPIPTSRKVKKAIPQLKNQARAPGWGRRMFSYP